MTKQTTASDRARLPLTAWAEDVQRLQLPMPAFGGVNSWIIGPPGRQAIIDNGLPGPETAAVWDAVLAEKACSGLDAVLLTHMHIDHVGQTAKLIARTVPLYMSVCEHADLTQLSERRPSARQDAEMAFLKSGGHPPPNGPSSRDYGVLAPIPRTFVPLETGAEILLGGIAFEIMLGGGHSSAAVCLICRDRKLIIAGDQILSGSGPQIAVWPHRPDADPLEHYFDFLDRLEALPDDLAVLPGHGSPILDFKAQVARIRNGHLARLDRLRSAIEAAASCADLIPLVFPGGIPSQLHNRVPYLVRPLVNYLANRGYLRPQLDDTGILRFEPVAR